MWANGQLARDGVSIKTLVEGPDNPPHYFVTRILI